MQFKNLLSLIACISITLLYFQCTIVIEEPLCLAPPPTINFVILDKNDKELLTSSNKDSLKISFMKYANNKQFIEDVKVFVADSVSATNNLFRSSVTTHQLISQSLNQQDPVFSLELKGVVIGKIQLKTFQKNEKCDGWATASEVRFNDKIVQGGLFIFKMD